MGHYLGLYHIWAYDNALTCAKDDYVEDTPLTDTNHFNCPSPGITSCGSQDMFMNFMDYVDDGCMNLFTKGQKERMITVMLNSPRRASLLNSPGLQSPGVVHLELRRG